MVAHGDGRPAEGEPDRPALHVAPDEALQLNPLARGDHERRLPKEDRHEDQETDKSCLCPAEEGGVGLAERRKERERPDCERAQRRMRRSASLDLVFDHSRV